MSKSFDKLKAAVAKAKSTGQTQENDESFWKLEGDSSGNGMAVLRFLPEKDEDSDSFVKVHNHGWKNAQGKWLIENCPKTLGNDCPICQKIGPLWNTGKQADKETYRQRKKKTAFIANILVIEDAANPDNVGKVFKWKFNNTIFKMIEDAISPEFADENPMNPFDLEEGANFKLKMRQVDGYANFEKSSFMEPEAVGTYKEIAKIMGQLHDLSGHVDPKLFKSYEELEKKYDAFVSGSVARHSAPVDDDEEDSDFLKKASEKKAAKKVVEDSDDGDDQLKEVEKKSTKKKEVVADPDEDDDSAFFSKLAADD